MVRRTLLAFPGFCGMAALLLVGCQKDEIQSYHTSKEQPVHLDLARANRPSLRMLTAIFPHGDRTWFFKLLGPETEVAQHKEEFDRFIQSVRFKDQAKEPVTWTVPDGWRSEPGVPSRYASHPG